jgi:hypothetical protein
VEDAPSPRLTGLDINDALWTIALPGGAWVNLSAPNPP